MFELATAARAWITPAAAALALMLAGCGGGDSAEAGVAQDAPSLHALAAPAANARNLPAGGKIRFLVGQTSPDIAAFRNSVLQDPGFLKPTGVTLYTHIAPSGCNGLSGSCNLGDSGNIVDYNATLAQNPGASLAVGLFVADGGSNQPLRALLGRARAEELAAQAGFPGPQTDLTDDVVNGYRQRLDALINYLKNTGRPVFLRFGYEFDGPWNKYSRLHFKEAFRYAKGRVDALGAANVAMVWQSATYPTDGDPAFAQDFSNPNHLSDWYPGDDVVDWVGMSAFYFDASFRTRQYTCRGVASPHVSANPQTLYNNLLGFARARSKPVMVAESTPVGYHLQNLTGSCVLENNPVPVGVSEIQLWYQNYFDFILANKDQIRAVAYINSNWAAIKQFNCQGPAGSATCTDGYWGNSALQANVAIKDYVKSRLADACFEGNAATCGSGNGGGGGGDSVPAAPSKLAGSAPTARSVALSWRDNANNESGYLIQRAVGNGAWVDLSTVGANASSFSDANLTPSTRYQYRVAARNNAGQSAFSNSVVVTTPNDPGNGGGGNGNATLPGVVSSSAYTGSRSFNVAVNAAGAYYFVISYSSNANSKLVVTRINGSTANAAVNSGSGSVQTIDFNGVAAGSTTLTVEAEAGVTIQRIEAFKR